MCCFSLISPLYLKSKSIIIGPFSLSCFSVRYSKLLLLYHQFKDRDTFYPADEILDGQLSYGCLQPDFQPVLQADGSTILRPYIKIVVKNTDTSNNKPDISPPINASYFQTTSPEGQPVIEARRKIGFDLHWTAATTCAICLYNGKKSYPNLYGDPAPHKMRVFQYNAGPNVDGPSPINGGQPRFTEYDSTNNLFKGNVNGTWKTFTLT